MLEFRVEVQIECDMDKRPNHRRRLSTFNKSIGIIKDHGFYPIAVTQLYNEDTFVFKTSDEAIAAYESLENREDSILKAWWYGLEEFNETVSKYETRFPNTEVKVFWLDT